MFACPRPGEVILLTGADSRGENAHDAMLTRLAEMTASQLIAAGMVVCVLSFAFAALTSPSGKTAFARAFGVSVALLITLMMLGAVFGKTLGDFLREAN